MEAGSEQASPGQLNPVTGLVTPPAVRINARRVVAAATVVWFVAFAVALGFAGRLQHDGHLWWMWTCLAGGVLGLAGSALMVVHRRQGRTV